VKTAKDCLQIATGLFRPQALLCYQCRIERAMFLLRTTDRGVTDVCLDVGFTSLGTFSRTFSDIVGRSPSEFRDERRPAPAVPSCFAMAWSRPSSFGEARTTRRG